MRSVVPLSAFLAVLPSCSRPSLPPPESSAQAPSTWPERAAQELNIVEAVYRYQFQHNPSGKDSSTLDFLFLARGASQREYKDPVPELLARFAGNQPPVEAWSNALQAQRGVRHREKEGKGIIFYVSRIIWIDDHTIEVDGGHTYASRNASENTYRVEHKNGAWSVVSARLTGRS